MPLYLYLDQRDLIDSIGTRTTVARRRLETLVLHGRVQVILSFAHAIETWKYQDKIRRKTLIDYADSLQPWWLLNRDYLFHEEARAAVYTHLGLPVRVLWTPDHAGQRMAGVGETDGYFCPFRKSLHEVFPQSRLDSPDRDAAPFLTLADMIDVMDTAPEVPSGLLKLDEAYASGQPFSRSNPIPLSAHKRFVSYIFSEAFADTSPRAAHLFSQFGAMMADLRSCPALDIYLRVRNAIHADIKTRPDASEMEDMVHLVALPYVDAFSTDKRIADYIRRIRLVPGVYSPERIRGMNVFRHLAPALDWLETNGASLS